MQEFPGGIQTNLCKEFDLPENRLNKDEFTTKLADVIEELIQKDFHRLINILYRLDVDEHKLKSELKERPEVSAGMLIANLIIERQITKLESRQQNHTQPDIPEDEKW